MAPNSAAPLASAPAVFATAGNERDRNTAGASAPHAARAHPTTAPNADDAHTALVNRSKHEPSSTASSSAGICASFCVDRRRAAAKTRRRDSGARMATADAWDAFGRDDGARATTARARDDARDARAAATHAFFENARELWSGARARDGAVRDARAVAEEIARAHDAGWASTAAELEEFAPSGRRARDALARCAANARAETWDACARWAKRTIEACGEQLGRGNWPVSGFLEAHTLAHGWLVVAGVAATASDAGEDVDEGALEDDPTASAACRGAEWSARERLGRIGLDLLTATTLFERGCVPTWCASAILLVERAFQPDDAEGRRAFPLNSAIPTTLPMSGVPTIEPSRQIHFEDARSLTAPRFYADFVASETPVVIRGHLDEDGENWAALDVFKNLDAFEKYADTIVPVEYGTAFDSHGVGVTTLGSFARDFLAPSNAAHDGAPTSDKVAYVSQHPIFHQIPELQSTFTVIPYTLGRLRVETSAVNLWLGTAGTRTAIHRDPYLNLLCQVSGYKYVRIYAVSETPHLYVADTDTLRGSNVNNFTRSPVDPESPTVSREHPRALAAKFLETILAPGDVLFMPKGHWHYVRSLTSSVSVNFWF